MNVLKFSLIPVAMVAAILIKAYFFDVGNPGGGFFALFVITSLLIGVQLLVDKNLFNEIRRIHRIAMACMSGKSS